MFGINEREVTLRSDQGHPMESTKESRLCGRAYVHASSLNTIHHCVSP